MAYPFCKQLTLDEFVAACCDRYGCAIVEQTLLDGESKRVVRALVRGDGPGTRYYACVPALDGADCLTPSVLRSLCCNLGIKPHDFGYSLDK